MKVLLGCLFALLALSQAQLFSGSTTSTIPTLPPNSNTPILPSTPTTFIPTIPTSPNAGLLVLPRNVTQENGAWAALGKGKYFNKTAYLTYKPPKPPANWTRFTSASPFKKKNRNSPFPTYDKDFDPNFNPLVDDVRQPNTAPPLLQREDEYLWHNNLGLPLYCGVQSYLNEDFKCERNPGAWDSRRYERYCEPSDVYGYCLGKVAECCYDSNKGDIYHFNIKTSQILKNSGFF